MQFSSGIPNFIIVGLADKAVGESKERVRAALNAMGLALPSKRIVVNLSPADLQKEGSHYDLPIALGVLVTLGVISQQDLESFMCLGELSLHGAINSVSGILPAAIEASHRGLGLICPKPCGGEAAWSGNGSILAPDHLLALVNHFKGTQVLSPPTPQVNAKATNHLDLMDLKGQETARRALEIAAAGGHNLLLQGPPGAGKSMLASRLPGILPPLNPAEALEVTMIHSIAGQLEDGQLLRHRPFRDPHHSASLPALVGGGLRAKPGEISLAHHGVLFLDELPEFARGTLETLRQPLESGRVMISRANAHITYPARFQLVAAMNPCRCGYMDDPERSCGRVPRCAQEYQSKISGPLLDRIDLNVFVPVVKPHELQQAPLGESSADVGKRVLHARQIQTKRFDASEDNTQKIFLNAHATGQLLESIATPDSEGQALMLKAAEKFKLSTRGYHRILRVARTIADLDNSPNIRSSHIAEAIAFRQLGGSV